MNNPMKAAAQLRRNIIASGMDEIATACFKATADDKLPPKEKHVLTLQRLMGEGDEHAEHVDAVLAKKLHGCRAAKTASVAAKALVVLHRLAIADHGDALVKATLALAGVMTNKQDRHPQAEYVAECAAYMRALCEWGGAGGLLRANADAAWHGSSPRDVLRAMPQMQQLTDRALEAASRGRFERNLALQSLRLTIVEDALCLFRAQVAGAAATHAGLLSLPPELVYDAEAGSALEVLEVSHALARKALSLHKELLAEASSDAPPAGLLELLSTRLLWQEGGTDVPADTPDAPAAPARDSFREAWLERAGSDSIRAEAAMEAEGAVWEERDQLLRALLEGLPTHTLTNLAERLIGRTVENASQLDTQQLRAIGAAEAMQAARLAKRHAPRQFHRKAGAPSAEGGDHQPSSSSPTKPSEAAQRWQEAARRASAGAESLRVAGAPPPSNGGSSPLKTTNRLAAVTDLEALQHTAPAFAMPPLALSRVPSLMRNSSNAFSRQNSSDSTPSTPRSPRGSMRALPPLPVPLAEMRPALLCEPGTAQLSLAAFELLVLVSERLGAGVRIIEILPNSQAARSGTLAAGDILYTCNDNLLLGSRQATSVLRAAAEGRTMQRGGNRLRLIDGREFNLGQPVPQQQKSSSKKEKREPPPFGIVTEPLATPNDAVGRGMTADRAEQILGAIRTRLNIPLRQQRWLMPILRTPLASDPPPLSPPAPISPAYRALLLLHARGGGDVAAAGGNGKTPAPRAGEVHAFVIRQISLLRNAVATSEASQCSSGSIGSNGSGNNGENGPAALRRLEAQAKRLLSLRFAPEDQAASSAGEDAAAGEERAESKAVMATLRELGVETRLVDAAGSNASDFLATASIPTMAEVNAAADYAAPASSLSSKSREKPVALLPRWPAAMGYRLYLCLLESLFENDEPAVLADDHEEVMAFLHAVWVPCSIDARRHKLALLAMSFDHYQQSGAPQLLPLIGEYLAQLLDSQNSIRNASPTQELLIGIVGGDEWTAIRMSEVLAGMVGYLSGKLRDYRGNFGCDPEELRGCAQLWCICVGALSGGGDGNGPRARISFTPSTQASTLIDRQARSLIEASMARHMRRVRLTLQQSADAVGLAAGVAAANGSEETPEYQRSQSLLLQEETLCRLAEAVGEEMEIEAQFASAFNGMILPQQHEAAASAAAAAGLKTAVQPPPPPAMMHALSCLEQEVKADVDGALRSFKTISGSGLTALQALLGLRSKMGALGHPLPMPQLDTLCEQMADGWCDEIPELLQTTLNRALERDTGEPVAVGVNRTSSAVDVFTQLDRLSSVFATFCQLPPTPLPQRVHLRFLELIETQVCTYVMRIAECAPLPPSSLQKERRGSLALQGGSGARERGLSDDSADGNPFAAVAAAVGGDPFAADPASPEPRRTQPRATDRRVEATSLRALCLRLNNCEWAGEQLLQLAARLRADVPGIGRLPGDAVKQSEHSCRDLLDYITARVVYYEIEPLLVSKLYLPTPEGSRLAPLLLPGLQPLLSEMRATVAPRWAQRLLESVLSTCSIAVAAVIELPDRRFFPMHAPMLDEDVGSLGEFFLSEAHGVLEEDVVRSSLRFLHALSAQACGPAVAIEARRRSEISRWI